MKHICNILVFSLISCLWINDSYAQATNCADSYLSPFCSGIAQYPANYDSTGAGSGPQAPAGPNYDCLGTQGNPTYFSLTIEQTGSIDFTLDNTANVDIDFIVWGPFNSLATANSACDSMGHGGTWGGIADCSYSGFAQEQVSIPNAQAGEVYILMVTNYANVATSIFSTQNSGSGNVACPCEIPYTIDTMNATAGNQGFLTDTINDINQFVVCPNHTLGIQVEAKAGASDTLSMYGPFTTVNNAFTNNTVFAFNPGSKDSLAIFTLVTPTTSDIGVNRFTIGMRNDLYTGGLTDSSCFDLLDIEVIVPGVQLNNKNVCSGESFQVIADSIPTTVLGSSNYTWTQISGPSVVFSSTSSRTPTITIPITAGTSSNDSTIIVVDYNYGGLCPMQDTMILYYPDMSIAASALIDSICAGDSTILTVALADTLYPAICDDYNVDTIPFSPLATTGGTIVNNFSATSTFGVSDEGVSDALPIGFDFDFYCNSFDTFYLHTNGFMTFDTISSSAGLLSGAGLPNANVPNNIIAFSWADLDVSNGGTINYYTQGVAPNRQLVVNYNAIQTWLGGSSTTTQVILNEIDNSIEIHITDNTLFSSIIGIEDGTGTNAHYHASLASTQGRANGPITNRAYRFSPKVFGPFYAWSPVNSINSATILNPTASPTATTTYQIEVSDGICKYIDTTVVHVLSTLSAPTVACDSSTTNAISFSWTNLNLPATGFYEYSIDGGNTWINVGATFAATATGLTANTSYTILVRANDGTNGSCPVSPSSSTTCMTLIPDCNANPPIAINLTPSHLACHNDSSGCVHATVSGGSGNPMNLAWSTGVSNIDSICNLHIGTYTLVVTDTIPTSGAPILCVDSQSITLTQPTVLAINIDNFTPPTCNLSTDGSISTTSTGGTPSYSYQWSHSASATSDDVNNLGGGTFGVTVTDANGCTDTTQITLVVPNAMTTTVDSVKYSDCTGTTDGAIYISINGGAQPLSYLWSNNSSNEDLTLAASGYHTVTITDANGCTDTIGANIIQPLTPILDAFVSAVGTKNTAVPMNSSVTISAGATGANYTWTSIADPVTGNANIANPNAATTVANPDPEGLYTYIVTANITTGTTTCTATDTVWIKVEPPFQGIPTAFSPDGDNINDTFRPVMLADDEIKVFRIYNRWGQEVYNADVMHHDGWDGTYKGVPQPTGVYIYLLEYKKASDSKPTITKGEFTLIR